MKKLNELISKVGYDKVAHFAIAGWAVSAASAYGFKWMAIVFVCVFFDILQFPFLCIKTTKQ